MLVLSLLSALALGWGVVSINLGNECAPVTASFNYEEGIENVVNYDAPKVITLPIEIQGTTLVAEKMVAYDGPFLEDGTGDEVTEVTALLVKNTGSKGIAWAQLCFTCTEGRLIFEADTIPPGSRTVILENIRKRFKVADVLSVTGRQIVEETGWEDWPVQIEETDMENLEISNVGEEPLYNIRIYYKIHLRERDFLMGGITYAVTVANLEPKQKVRISPARYVKGYSKVVRLTYTK